MDIIVVLATIVVLSNYNCYGPFKKKLKFEKKLKKLKAYPRLDPLNFACKALNGKLFTIYILSFLFRYFLIIKIPL